MIDVDLDRGSYPNRPPFPLWEKLASKYCDVCELWLRYISQFLYRMMGAEAQHETHTKDVPQRTTAVSYRNSSPLCIVALCSRLQLPDSRARRPHKEDRGLDEYGRQRTCRRVCLGRFRNISQTILLPTLLLHIMTIIQKFRTNCCGEILQSNSRNLFLKLHYPNLDHDSLLQAACQKLSCCPEATTEVATGIV